MSSNRSRSRSRSKSRSKPKTPEKNECSICYTPIENESDKKTCKICKSKFHKECLDHWCNMPNNAVCPCPICRQTIQTRKNTLPIKELIKYWKEFNNDQVDPEEFNQKSATSKCNDFIEELQITLGSKKFEYDHDEIRREVCSIPVTPMSMGGSKHRKTKRKQMNKKQNSKSIGRTRGRTRSKSRSRI